MAAEEAFFGIRENPFAPAWRSGILVREAAGKSGRKSV
jgi:hypothetical protein